MAEWGICTCGDGSNDHDAVVLQPICIDPGNRVLFEGTLGRCLASGCDCAMYTAAALAAKGGDRG